MKRYFSLGSESEPEGRTFIVNVYSQTGEFVAGIPNPENLYKSVEITEEEYKKYMQRASHPNNKGFFGLVNSTGKAAVEAKLQELRDRITTQQAKEEALVTKRLARQVDMGIIDEEDIDTAISIELPNISRGNVSVDDIHANIKRNVSAQVTKLRANTKLER